MFSLLHIRRKNLLYFQIFLQFKNYFFTLSNPSPGLLGAKFIWLIFALKNYQYRMFAA